MEPSTIFAIIAILIGFYLLGWLLFIAPLIKSSKIKDDDKILWISLIVLAYPVGAALFWAFRPDRKAPLQPGQQQANPTHVNIPQNAPHAGAQSPQAPNNTVLYK